MAPPKKMNSSAPPEPTRRRTRAQLQKEMMERRKKQKTGAGSDPSRPRLLDSDSDQETSPLALAAPRLVPYAVSPEPPVIEELEVSAGSATHMQTEETQGSSESTVKVSVESLTSGSSEKTMTDASEDGVFEASAIFPPLASTEVTLAEYVKQKLRFDVFDRKSGCQYNQSKLEAEYPDVWIAKDPFSEKFRYEEGVEKFQLFKQYAVFPEKLVPSSFAGNSKLLSLLEKSNLVGAVQDLEPFVTDVVVEFYANFVPVDDCVHDISFVYMRGRLYEFSPRMINHVLGLKHVHCTTKEKFKLDISVNRLASELTRDEKTIWESFQTTMFSSLLNALYILCCRNWMPSTNHSYVREERARLCYKIWKGLPFNLGKIIYDEVADIVKEAEPSSLEKRKILPFPALIFRTLEFQKSVPLTAADMKEPGLKTFKFDSTRRARRTPSVPSGGYKAGASQSADLRHILKLMTEYTARVEGMTSLLVA